MFAGRKLLVADDSPYYRTVIGLTFSDEGMEVTTVGDGRQALESIEQFQPDVILASISMPVLSGYELCRLIKQSERFGHIPVMLLAGLHEHFDQAEARRAGADDVVPKPFKSIRELVGRVGSLLGGKTADDDGPGGHGYSTLGLNSTERSEPSDATPETEAADLAGVADENNMTDVKVFVEAPLMAEHEPAEAAPEPAASTCAADVEMQTADTQQLQRIVEEPEPPAPIDYAQDDTREMEPVAQERKPEVESDDIAPGKDLSPIETPEMNEQLITQTAPLPTRAVLNDALLDLGDFDLPTQVAVDEDLILDLDFEEPAGATREGVPETVAAATPAFAAVLPVVAVAVEPEVASEYAPTHEEQHTSELNEWAIVTDAPATLVTASPVEEQKRTEPDVALSPAVIDAIARRAVELLSEKVVREIAWEVVPELAELLIKQKLEDQR